MKILVIGNGGREHALGWKLAQSRHQPQLFFAPGNPGVEKLGQRLEIEVTDIEGLALFAQREQIDLTVVGPEVPLSLGLADVFKKHGLLVFGPPQAGARLESSKQFSKEMMALVGVPTASSHYCVSREQAQEALHHYQPPYVIKENGLAAGKGVTIAASLEEARDSIEGAAGLDILIEEFMEGRELSILAFCDGIQAVPMIAAQDFKRIGDGDTGPNTGGMGAYAPVPFVGWGLMDRILCEVLRPMMQVLSGAGIDYRGVLYAGLMITPEGDPRVVEFNCRFGDPETQPLMMLLEEDLVDLMMDAAQGDLTEEGHRGLKFKTGHCALTVVLASEGYPGNYPTGFKINLPDVLPEGVEIFHAGTKKMPNGDIVTAGGRVLNVTAIGKTLEEAREKAYAVAEQIQFQGKVYRKDIAASAIPVN